MKNKTKQRKHLAVLEIARRVRSMFSRILENVLIITQTDKTRPV